MAALVCLYLSIRVSILSDWISDEDVCCLDSALCCHELRKKYLDTLPYCSLYNEQFFDTDDVSKLYWVTSRGVRLKKISLVTDSDFVVFDKVLAESSLKSFDCLWCRMSPFLACFVQKHQLKIKSLWFNKYSDLTLSELCPLINAVECSYLRFRSPVTKDVYRRISDLCPGVRKFHGVIVAKDNDDHALSVVRDNLTIEINCRTKATYPTIPSEKNNIKFSMRSTANSGKNTVRMCGIPLTMIQFKVDHVVPEAAVSKLHSLESVELVGSNFDHGIDQKLLESICENCTQLTHINVSYAVWTENVLHLIQVNGPHLRTFVMHGYCHFITSVVAKVVECCAVLETLDVHVLNGFVDVDVMNAVFHKCTRLTKVALPSNLFVPLEHIVRWMRSKSKLTFDLVINNRESMEDSREGRLNGLKICWLLNCEQYKRLFECGSSNLLKVVFIDRRDVTDNDFRQLVCHCRQLTSIKISNCAHLSGQVLSYLSKLPHLTNLDLSEVEGISHKLLNAFLRVSSSLTSLSLQKCPGLCKTVVQLVSMNCTRLTFLDVTDCEGITDDDVLQLLLLCDHLQLVLLENTSVTQAVFSHPKCEETGFRMRVCCKELFDGYDMLTRLWKSKHY